MGLHEEFGLFCGNGWKSLGQRRIRAGGCSEEAARAPRADARGRQRDGRQAHRQPLCGVAHDDGAPGVLQQAGEGLDFSGGVLAHQHHQGHLLRTGYAQPTRADALSRRRARGEQIERGLVARANAAYEPIGE